MNIEFDNEGHRYLCDLASGVSLVSPIRFDKADSNPWNADAASKSPVTIGDFVGSTQSGGSCNVDQLSMIPHCHGTHTETIGHIVDGDHFVSDLSIPSLIPAVVVSVSAIEAESTSETYLPSFGKSDRVITAEDLKNAYVKWKGFAASALIIRAGSTEGFFTNEAMAAIVEVGFEHLLVDLPSVDRLDDDGLLSNHRIFWNLEAASREVASSSRVNSHDHRIDQRSVPTKVTDGPCLLSIQVPAIESDAAPSRPVVFPITRV